MKILVTGAAGFIGFHTAKALLERGDEVIGIDNVNPYYDVRLKDARLAVLGNFDNFAFYKEDISDIDALKEIVKKHRIDKIVHLAAQAGVRHSLENPFSYEKNNNLGTLNMLEIARHHKIRDLIFASSSSVYGGNAKMPFSETDDIQKPISLYAATKRYGELMCHTYHHLFGIRCRCLRFFTAYGPFGRPDMALFIFTRKILAGQEIDVFNNGQMTRDFTYIDDIRQGILGAIDNDYGYEIFNLARGESVELLAYIKAVETALGRKAKMNMMPIQPGDVPATSADISKAKRMLGYDPKISVSEGVPRFIEWYKEFYHAVV